MDNPNRIPRVRISESDFPAKIPDGIEDSYLEVVNKEGETIALFFLYNSLHKKFQDGLEFADYYDRFWDELEKEDYDEMMEVCGVSEVDEIPDSYMDACIKGNYSKWPMALSGMAMLYGRSKFPYGRKEQAKGEYKGEHSPGSDYIPGGYSFLDLLYNYEIEGSNIKDDFVDFIIFYFELIDVMDSIEKFRIIFVSPDLITRFIELDFEIIAQVAEHLFTKDNIDLFIDAANTEKKTIALAFLLDYKNKNFPADRSNTLELTI